MKFRGSSPPSSKFTTSLKCHISHSLGLVEPQGGSASDSLTFSLYTVHNIARQGSPCQQLQCWRDKSRRFKSAKQVLATQQIQSQPWLPLRPCPKKTKIRPEKWLWLRTLAVLIVDLGQFLAPTWQFTTTSNSNSKGSNTLYDLWRYVVNISIFIYAYMQSKHSYIYKVNL